MTIRLACTDDLERMMELYGEAREFMREQGNSHQWVDGYPSLHLVSDDVARRHAYVCTDEQGLVLGVFCLIPGDDPTYARIEEGAWLDDAPYSTVHRLATVGGGRGIGRFCLQWCLERVRNLRVDTHRDNVVMRHLLETMAFRRCGIIYTHNGTPRIAYQKVLSANEQNRNMEKTHEVRGLSSSLVRYVEQEVLPRYASFDKAHREDHARKVMDESMRLSAFYEVDVNMVYAIAAYHDVGLCEGRELHHLVSGRMLLADERLRTWFSADQLQVMKEAVEDHRASNRHAPRSIYGKIVAEADRVIDPQVTLRRTVQYGLANCPELDVEAQYVRFRKHLVEKYAEGGYLQLWIPESDNAGKLAELRRLIGDEDRLRTVFDGLYASELKGG